MSLNINNFVSNIAKQGGLASPNKYRVVFNSPNGGDNQDVSIMCNVSSLPARALQTIENRHFNTPYKLPYSANYADITFSFVNTLGMKERQFFEDWQDKVIEPSTGLIGFYNNFVGDIVVQHLAGDTGESDYSIKIYEAYPIDINEVALGYSMTNETLISGVSFSYKYWERI